MFQVKNPGSWQSYVNRPENRGLPTLELKQRYIKESFFFQQSLVEQAVNQPSVSAASAGGGGGGQIDPSENEYIDNDYIDDDYFE